MKSKKVNRKRNKAITIRMSEAEYNAMMNKMKETGLTQQAFIIGSVMDATLLTDEGLQELKTISEAYADILRQLRGIGTNVNQMAYWMNAAGIYPDTMQLDQFGEQIKDYRKECEELWRSIRLLTNQKSTAVRKLTDQ